MHKNFVLMVVITGVILALTWGLDFTSHIPSHPIQTDTKPTSHTRNFYVPDFSYTTHENKTFHIKDHRGRVVLIHFWASWCAPCVTELPRLIEFGKNHKNDVIILAISSDRELRNEQRFLKKIKAPASNSFIHFISDPKGEITRNLFQTTYLPETILVDPQGVMADKIVGDADWENEGVIRRVTDLFMPHNQIENNKDHKPDKTQAQNP